MTTSKRYREEFKRDTIRYRATSGQAVSEIERELGLSHNLLRQWKKRYQVNATSNELERSAVEQLRAELQNQGVRVSKN